MPRALRRRLLVIAAVVAAVAAGAVPASGAVGVSSLGLPSTSGSPIFGVPSNGDGTAAAGSGAVAYHPGGPPIGTPDVMAVDQRPPGYPCPIGGSGEFLVPRGQAILGHLVGGTNLRG